MVPPPFRLPVLFIPQQILPSITQKKTSRQKFSADEDKKLRDLVMELGETNWNEVASRLGTRSARQCRERFKNYLSPSIRNDPWTEEDDATLKAKYAEHGPKWSLIATFFPARSDVNIKNHWTRLANKSNKEHDVEAEKRELIEQINMVIENTKRPNNTNNNNVYMQQQPPPLQNAFEMNSTEEHLQQPQNMMFYPPPIAIESSKQLPIINNLPTLNHNNASNNACVNGSATTGANISQSTSDFENDLSGLDWDNSDDNNCMSFFDDCIFYN